MTSTAICSDSSSLLTPVAALALGVELVPVAVSLDDETWDGDEHLDEFYDRIRAGAVATTSQPSPGAFVDAYARASARGASEVLSIHLDQRVSGTARSADLAAQESSIPVLVVDVPTVSFGVAVCVRAAAKAVTDGGDAAVAAEVALRVGAGLDNVFVVHGARAGRVDSSGRDWNVLRFADGVAQLLSTRATVDRAAEAMAGRIAAAEPGSVAVGHAGRALESWGDSLAHAVLRTSSTVAVERYRVGASVGAHTGPETFGAFWWTNR